MSQMDLSQQGLAAELPSDEENDQAGGGTSRDDDGGGGGGGVGSAVHASAAEDEFVDAMDGFGGNHLPDAQAAVDHNQNQNGSESNYGILERCGRWLMAIPRDDVVALQQTSEYRKFLSAFDKLGEAHRRTVTLERQHLMESEEDDMAGYSTNASALANFATPSNTLHHPGASPTNNRLSTSIATMQPGTVLSHPLSPTSALRRRRYSFLQHLAVDDVLLRIFEFIDCSSLVRTGTTCHRFRELTTRSAEQRTHRLADGRLLRSAMKMLRAQEQIEGVGPREGTGPFVPIPMLGLRRRIRVSGAGDPEFDGIYFCTGSNGNGFLFTKPRSSEMRRVRVRNNPTTFNMQQLVELDEVGMIEGIPVRGAGDADNDDVLGPEMIVDGDDAVDNGDAVVNDMGEDAIDMLFGDEPNRSRQLRCLIAKRFSNETILWYMSKEVEDETSHEISQRFSFWAKLLVTGDATPNVCQYPSQTSILSRNGEPAWQPLTNTADIVPPIVELVDL